MSKAAAAAVLRRQEVGLGEGKLLGGGGRERKARTARLAPSEIRRAVKRERGLTGGDKSQPAADQAQPELQQGPPSHPRDRKALQNQQRAVVQQSQLAGRGRAPR